MAMYYNVSLNQGNEAIGSGKSITVNEVLNTVDEHALAHHIHLHNQLIPEQVAESVLHEYEIKHRCRYDGPTPDPNEGGENEE